MLIVHGMLLVSYILSILKLVYIKGYEKEKIAVMQTNIMDINGEVLGKGEAKVMLPS